jgi:GNAT superfamily N-acetyltransferase
MSLPAGDGEWRDLVRAGMPPCWSQVAEGSGGSVWRDEDVVASIVPKAPDRSVFNSVFYEDPERLLASLDRIQAAYDEAGVRAWTVWVPEADAVAAAGLKEAGHVLDAEPRYMGMLLSDLRGPELDGTFEMVEREDYAALARINEISYGYPPGDFAAVAEAPMPGIRIYFAELEGEPVSTLGVWPHRSDAAVIWVATLPEARNRGISSRLMAQALRNAREDGYETTTLQSTKLGRPVYEKLGYRDFGAAHMWERRRD